MGKLYVRERQNAGKGTGKPRFEIVAVTGLDLRIYHSHIRKSELEKLAEDIGAEIVNLPRGEKVESGEDKRGGRGRHRDGRQSNQD